MTCKNQIIEYINKNVGEIFIVDDFYDIAGYNTIRGTLNRLSTEGKIKRIIKGFYYKPKYFEELDDYELPSIPKLAKAIARKYNWNIAPSGNTALNLLGLDTQVPSKWTFISDGRYMNVQVGNSVIEFKHRKSSEISNMSEDTAIVIQAIKAIGKDKIGEKEINYLKNKLSELQKEKILYEGRKATKWIYQIIRKICEIN